MNSGNGWRVMNQRVQQNSPCSVGILVNRGFGDCVGTKRVRVIFPGGLDGRKGSKLRRRMAEHPTVTVQIIRFIKGHEEVLEMGDGISIETKTKPERRYLLLTISPKKFYLQHQFLNFFLIHHEGIPCSRILNST